MTVLPLPLLAVQVGHNMGNLRSSRRLETYPRMQSRQKECLQGSGRATESSGIFSIHIPHWKTCWTVWESLIRSAERGAILELGGISRCQCSLSEVFGFWGLFGAGNSESCRKMGTSSQARSPGWGNSFPWRKEMYARFSLNTKSK